MKKITIAVSLFLTLGLVLISCNDVRKEVKSETTETVKEVKIKEVVGSKIHKHSDEMAMATFQCPMKCEGDKTYTEAGTCPKCKMDIKKIEVDVLDDTEKPTESEKDKEEENK